MKIIVWQNAKSEQRRKALARPACEPGGAAARSIAAIVRAVKNDGDTAVRKFSRRFDGSRLKNSRVPPQSVKNSIKTIDSELLSAIKQAKANIEKFHAAGKPRGIRIETMAGVKCASYWRAIDAVGIYVPGGTAPLFSSVLMQAIPARLAGCRRVILCSPPQKNGKVHPAILAAAHLCGVTEIHAIGGAQAIAAMAYGTTSVPKVDKIFGPGNVYVTIAKQIVSQDPEGAAIDMPAGPSEVMVITEKSARPDWVAADLLAQAEHDETAQAILVTTSAAFGEQVRGEVMKQLARLPRRAIAGKAIEKSRIIVAANMTIAIEIANRYAPEHLIIHNKDAARWLTEIRNAGSIFLGAWTPESAGDYASGTNHVLPTGGHARVFGGLTVASFMKNMTVQNLTSAGLRRLGPVIETMAEAEGLQGHARAVSVRIAGSKFLRLNKG